MVDHRALQRTLFRAQLDPGFARALRAGEPEAERSTGLGSRELGWLRRADPAALAADRGGARREQFLRNVSSELAMTVSRLGAGALEGFASSAELHRAVRSDGSLPLALATYLAPLARAAGREASALHALEAAMARARGRLRSIPRPPRGGEVVLAPWAHLLRVPAGTLALASALRQGEAGPDAPSGSSAPGPAKAAAVGLPGLGTAHETLLLIAEAQPAPFRLRELSVEVLPDPVARFARRAERPLAPDARTRFARRAGAAPEELEALVQDLVADRALLAAPDSGR